MFTQKTNKKKITEKKTNCDKKKMEAALNNQEKERLMLLLRKYSCQMVLTHSFPVRPFSIP